MLNNKSAFFVTRKGKALPVPLFMKSCPFWCSWNFTLPGQNVPSVCLTWECAEMLEMACRSHVSHPIYHHIHGRTQFFQFWLPGCLCWPTHSSVQTQPTMVLISIPPWEFQVRNLSLWQVIKNNVEEKENTGILKDIPKPNSKVKQKRQ